MRRKIGTVNAMEFGKKARFKSMQFSGLDRGTLVF